MELPSLKTNHSDQQNIQDLEQVYLQEQVCGVPGDLCQVQGTVCGEDSEHNDGQAQWPQEGSGGEVNTPWETFRPMWIKQLFTADHSWGQGRGRGGPPNSRGDLDSATSHHAGAGGIKCKG